MTWPIMITTGFLPLNIMIPGTGLLIHPCMTTAPESFEFIYYSGLRNIRSGNIDFALTYFEKLIEKYPDVTA